MSTDHVRPNTEAERNLACESAAAVAVMMDFISPQYCDHTECDHTDTPSLNGYQMMVMIREALHMLGDLCLLATKTALFDGSIPEDERRDYFDGTLAVDETGPVYVMSG